MTYTEQIEIEVTPNHWEVMDVKFEGNPKWCNDSAGGLDTGIGVIWDDGKDYVSFENTYAPTWNKSLYNDAQNKVIEEAIDRVEIAMCNIYAKTNPKNEKYFSEI
jgi:hypothetical protein